MNDVVIVQTETLLAVREGCQVSVYQKQTDNPNHYHYLGAGRYENGIILGSRINCGVLAHVEPLLRDC